MREQQKVIYLFGPFRLDPRERQLTREGDAVLLKGKAFDLLLALVRSGGQLVTKDELMQEVWSGSVVEESNLTVHISTLRKALGEQRGEAKFIESVPRYGYRFLCEVEVSQAINGSLPERLALPAAAPTIAPQSGTHKTTMGLRLGRTNNVKRFVPLMVLVFVAAIISALVVTSHKSSNRKLADSRFLQPKFSRLTTSATIGQAAISGDGKYIVYSVSANGKQSLWLRMIANSLDLQILPPDDVVYSGMAISPDSQTLYYDKTRDFGSNSGIYQIPLPGGVEKKLLNARPARQSASHRTVKVSPLYGGILMMDLTTFG